MVGPDLRNPRRPGYRNPAEAEHWRHKADAKLSLARVTDKLCRIGGAEGCILGGLQHYYGLAATGAEIKGSIF